jgi:integrase
MTTTPTQQAISALLAQAAAQGLTLDDLVAAQTGAVTVADYIAEILPTASAGRLHTYEPYLRRFATAYGTHLLATITATHVTGFTQDILTTAESTRGNRRIARGGRSAQENAIAALRWMFARAIGDHLITDNPALSVAKPARPRQTRHGLTANQLKELFRVTATGGDDCTLDALVTRFIVETGARREGVLKLRLRDLDDERCTVLLREKNDKDGSEQPASPGLLRALRTFAASRDAIEPNDAVFRYKPKKGERIGRPLTRRRFNTLADRWQATLPFAARLGVTPHSLRHTAIGLVESVAGYAIARRFARHHSRQEVTTTYLQRDIHDVAWAVQHITGEPHPLAKDRWQLQ